MLLKILSMLFYCICRWKILVNKNGLLPKREEISGSSSLDPTTCESLNFRSSELSYFSVSFYSAWIEEANLKPYFQFKDTLSKTSKAAPFREAVEAIESYVENQRQGGGNVSYFTFTCSIIHILYFVLVYLTDWRKRIRC
jgi:hypothetical protein